MDDVAVRWLMAPGAPELLTIDDLLCRPAWMARAACRSDGTAAYFPVLGATAAAGKAVCAGCVVRSDCLAYAMEDPELAGVWGGTTARERAKLRRAA
ncbi:MAG: WhiB family transcriptional regulator [Acidimicrobiales bacterium]